jgi:hypothetical protein
MVPHGDNYEEYVVIDNGTEKYLERIGDTSISLSGYATESYVDNAVKNLVSNDNFTAVTNALSSSITSL